jgi:hypothetical protein
LHTIDIHITETIDHARLLPKSASKLTTTVKDLATKVRYTAAGTAPGSGGPSGSTK